MQYVTQSELDALAADANASILPLVNAIIAASRADPTKPVFESANFYDKYLYGPPVNLYVNSLAYPQPTYSFTPVVSVNLIPGGATYDGSGNYTLPTAIAAAGDYNLVLGANDVSMTIQVASPFVANYTTNNLYLAVGTALTFQGTAGQPVTATLARSNTNWLNELNRIRGDALALFLGIGNPPAAYAGAEKLFQNPSMVSSGPWIVGVNDNDTYPLVTYLNLKGVLLGGLNGTPFSIFKSVGFLAAPIPSGFSVDTALLASGSSPSSNNYTMTGTGTLKLTWHIPFTNNVSTPSTSDFTVTLTGIGSPTLSIIPNPSGVTGQYILLAKTSASVSAGGSFTFAITISSSFNLIPAGQFYDSGGFYHLAGDFSVANWHYQTGSSNDIQFWGETSTGIDIQGVPGAAVTAIISRATLNNNPTLNGLTAALVYSTASTAVSVWGLHPTAGTSEIACAGLPGTAAFSLNGATGQPAWMLSDPTVKGIWLATTLPAPANNVFIDQDIPPYIGRVAADAMDTAYGMPDNDVAVAGNAGCDGTTAHPWASTMRQTAPTTLKSDKINPTTPGITTRAARWLTRRDTDFIPADMGFNTNWLVTYYPNQVLSAGGLSYYNVTVPPTTTGVKIRLVAVNTGAIGWRSGSFGYGTPLGVNLPIFVKQTSFATPSSYDFTKGDNTVTIDPDGGGSYLALVVNNGFNFTVQNNTAGDVAFDVVVEIDNASFARNYFPRAGVAECFSYNLDGTPGAFAQYNVPARTNANGTKPIPKSGYCIFTLRATRLPVDNGFGIATVPASGPALTITIGQNKWSGMTPTFTPLGITVTIPATARDSGDVSVFIPVLGGNELVYQCSSQVMLEAFANFQPIFFNTMYAQGQAPFNDNFGFCQPNAMFFQYALSFLNSMEVSYAGWASPKGRSVPYDDDVPSVVVFPLFRELYDDLVSVLALAGGQLGGGNFTTGAGSSGGAGDAGNQGAGGDSGSEML